VFVPLLVADNIWVTMSSRHSHTCAILRSYAWDVSPFFDNAGRPFGAVRCWGTITDGGVGASSPATVPQEIAAATTWLLVETGVFHSCAISNAATSSRMRCWGSNRNGQATVPNQASSSWSAVSLGRSHTCGLLTSGQMQCWGLNDVGQTAVPNQSTARWTSVSAGWFFTCGILNTGLLRCWGENQNGQLNIPNDVIDSQWSMVTAGRFHTCGILASSGRVRCWGGAGSFYRAGVSSEPVVNYGQAAVPADLAAAAFSSIQAAGNGWHTCGIQRTGETRCWGLNSSGQTTVPNFAKYSLASVSPGVHHTCGLLSSGIMLCWGSNSQGQLNIPLPA
jgi:hypothetical protein